MSSDVRFEIRFGLIPKTGQYGLAILDEQGKDVKFPLLFDAAPDSLDNHLIVAAGAIWGFDVARQFKFGGVLNEQVVQTWREAAGVNIAPVGLSAEKADKPRPTNLSVELTSSILGYTPGRDETILGLVPSERFHGSLTGIKERIIGANAWMFDGETQLLALLAAGTLYADELLAGRIGIGSDLEPTTAIFASKVLSPVGIDAGQEARERE